MGNRCAVQASVVGLIVAGDHGDRHRPRGPELIPLDGHLMLTQGHGRRDPR
jgi:hypothetical protein